MADEEDREGQSCKIPLPGSLVNEGTHLFVKNIKKHLSQVCSRSQKGAVNHENQILITTSNITEIIFVNLAAGRVL